MYLGFWKRVLINGIFFIAIAGLYSSGLPCGQCLSSIHGCFCFRIVKYVCKTIFNNFIFTDNFVDNGAILFCNQRFITRIDLSCNERCILFYKFWFSTNCCDYHEYCKLNCDKLFYE